MTRRNVIAALLIGGAAFVMFFTPTGELASQSIRQVIVTNFPITQSIEGEVSITNPVRLSKLIKIEDVIVPPAGGLSVHSLERGQSGCATGHRTRTGVTLARQKGPRGPQGVPVGQGHPSAEAMLG